MLHPDQLREICRGIRSKTDAVDDALVAGIEADVEEYRKFLSEPRPQLPPDELAERLPLMGWLIYEASLMRLWPVQAGFPALAGEPGAASRESAALIERLADAARHLPWPEFAPRALGALRAQALVASKQDTPTGYDEAWLLHQEARTKHQAFIENHDPSHDRLRLDLNEVLLQLALAETGTACRTAEQVIGLWQEQWQGDDPDMSNEDSQRWTQKMFRQLAEGAEVGERALEIARDIKKRYGLVHEITEQRMALVTAFRNPAIMTCRALLLMYSMVPEMRRVGRVPSDAGDWPSFQTRLRERFDTAVAYLREPVQRKNGEDWSLLTDHARSIVQLCLHLGLLSPDHILQEPLVVDDTLILHRLDDAAVTAMCEWLATEVNGKQRGDANVIGSASKPSFVWSVEDCRHDDAASARYRDWRLTWFELDRYAGLDGRRDRIEQMLRDERDPHEDS